jgi:hypothetical protein
MKCRFVENKCLFFCKKDVTRILSVFLWDVRCGEDLDVILIPSTSLNSMFYYKNIGKFRIRINVLNVLETKYLRLFKACEIVIKTGVVNLMELF